jgi:hypothetical protein
MTQIEAQRQAERAELEDLRRATPPLDEPCCLLPNSSTGEPELSGESDGETAKKVRP